jgi:hypothetical protein
MRVAPYQVFLAESVGNGARQRRKRASQNKLDTHQFIAFYYVSFRSDAGEVSESTARHTFATPRQATMTVDVP